MKINDIDTEYESVMSGGYSCCYCGKKDSFKLLLDFESNSKVWGCMSCGGFNEVMVNYSTGESKMEVWRETEC